MDETDLFLRVSDIWLDGEAIRFFELRTPDGSSLPPFTPGAHVNVELGNALARQYSLVNDPAESDRYVIAVALDPASRGGSSFMHTQVALGDLLRVSTPRSHFELIENAPHTVLFAGGIGITPLWAMVQRLETLRKSWELHFGARTPQAAALIAPLTKLRDERGKRVAFYFLSENNRMMDFANIIGASPAGSHFYCCGPAGMLDAYKSATAGLPSEHVHFEQFSPAAPAALTGGFQVELAKSGKLLDVKQGESILATLLANGVQVKYSCREGVCGECETTVLDGTPDHRDAILTDDEKASGKTMMICCSGSLSKKLILDR